MKTHIELPMPRDKLSPEPITSPLKKKSRTTFGSPVNDSENNEKWTCSDEIGGRGGEKLEATTTQGNIKEELKPNLDQVIDNIQIEPIMYAKLVVSITKLVVVATKSFQRVQPEVEPI